MQSWSFSGSQRATTRNCELRFRPSGASCRRPVRQPALHRSATRLSSSSCRATGEVPQDRGLHSSAEGWSALRRSRRRNRRVEPQPIPLRLVRGCAAGQGFGARAAGRKRSGHEGRGMVSCIARLRRSPPPASLGRGSAWGVDLEILVTTG